MQDDLVNTTTDHGCFGCGEQNPIGLRLKFYRVDGGLQAKFTPSKHHEGYDRMTHGGIVATLLDEAMSWAVIDSGRLAVTARMELQFRRPVSIGEPLVVSARIERDRKRLVDTSGEL
ncbi:MAG TPA: PaaI family thioesterase, partial [Nitrolancea sp.]|nr:PaaI family thioesterase [Nitrolancea sp.]